MKSDTPQPLLRGPVWGGHTAHSPAWTRALVNQAEAAKDAMLARMELCEAEQALNDAQLNGDEELITKRVQAMLAARGRMYRELYELSGAQARVIDMAHGPRFLMPDDITTSLNHHQIKDLAALLDRDESDNA